MLDQYFALEKKTAILIPTLNEEKNIQELLTFCLKSECTIFVIDGGSSDKTIEFVHQFLDSFPEKVFIIHNEKKIQAAGINKFLSLYGEKFDYYIRMDAHAGYPPNFIQGIISLLDKNIADSIVVPMQTVGFEGLQKSAAVLFNSRLGNGGSPHRKSDNSKSRYVNHGHHAGFNAKKMLALNGYDEEFVVNEDAEYDARLIKSSGKIYLSLEHQIEYYPRKTYKDFIKQFFKYGSYRSLNAFKRKTLPNLRQLIPLLISLSFLSFIFVLPFAFILDNYFFMLMCIPFALYLALVFIFSCLISKKIIQVFQVFSLAVVTHLSFGLGYIHRIFKLYLKFGRK
jgi:succinoglycan biosynthesis protein ExoA